MISGAGPKPVSRRWEKGKAFWRTKQGHKWKGARKYPRRGQHVRTPIGDRQIQGKRRDRCQAEHAQTIALEVLKYKKERVERKKAE